MKIIREKHLEIIVGVMSILVVLYRIIYLMIPMLKDGFKRGDFGEIFSALSLVV